MASYNKSAFSQKLKILRITHGLTHQTLARYASYIYGARISSGAISYWENDKRTASIDNVLTLADIFGVSIDWLVAAKDNEFNIYSERRLENLETTFLSPPYNVDVGGVSYPFNVFDKLPKDYLNPQTRKLTYSLLTRANIIFLFHVIAAEWMNLISKNIDKLKPEDFSDFNAVLSTLSGQNGLKQYKAMLDDIIVTKKPLFMVIS